MTLRKMLTEAAAEDIGKYLDEKYGLDVDVDAVGDIRLLIDYQIGDLIDRIEEMEISVFPKED